MTDWLETQTVNVTWHELHFLKEIIVQKVSTILYKAEHEQR